MGEVNQVTGVSPGIKFACDICCATVLSGQEQYVGGQRVCGGCASEQRAKAPVLGGAPGLATNGEGQDALLRAGLLGSAGALVAAAFWAAVVVLTDYEIGYLAVAVGFLAGFGVKLGARGAHGKPLQQLAVACTVLGLFAAKYFIFAHFLCSAAASEGVALGYFSFGTMAAFPSALGELLSPFDLLWLFIAVSAAWRVPAPPVPPS
jgi:hypothetical protein